MKKKGKKYLLQDEQSGSSLAKNKLGDAKSFQILLSFAAKFKWGFIVSIGMILLSTVFALFSARLMGSLVEFGLLKNDWDASIYFSAFIFGLELVAIVVQWLGRRKLSKVASKTILSIREALFDYIGKLPLSFYDRQPQGRVITRVTHDVETLEEFFTDTMGKLINSLFFVVVAITAMLVTNLKLGLLIVLSAFPVFIFTMMTRNPIRDINRKMSALSSRANSKLSEFLNGHEVIRSFGLEKWSKKEYDDIVQSHTNAQLRANSLYAKITPVSGFLSSLPIIWLIWFGGKQVLAGALGVGIFVAFIRYTDRLMNPILNLAREFAKIQQAFTSIERVMSFLSHKIEEETLGKNGNVKDELWGNVSFKNLHMYYEDPNEEEEAKPKWILNNISFDIEEGQKIGLVGRTGSGKTTVVSLINRLYEYQKGFIFLDNKDIRVFDRNYLRSKIGVVSQEVVLFKGNWRDNLKLDEEMSDQEILESCERTGLLEVMHSNSYTLDSEILDAGSNLSVGEKQLISLTRILLKDPRLLILDEATANIDPYYESIIQKAINLMMKGRTCLIIAHRLQTLKDCDKLLVFKGGELIEEGSHETLMNEKGYFYSLQNAQGLMPDRQMPPA